MILGINLDLVQLTNIHMFYQCKMTNFQQTLKLENQSVEIFDDLVDFKNVNSNLTYQTIEIQNQTMKVTILNLIVGQDKSGDGS